MKKVSNSTDSSLSHRLNRFTRLSGSASSELLLEMSGRLVLWHPTIPLIKAANPEMGDDLIAFGTRAMNEAGIVRSGDAATLGVGAMTEARWQRFHAAMADIGVLPAALEWKKAFDLSLVNKGIGKA